MSDASKEQSRSNPAPVAPDRGRHPYGPRSLAALIPDVTRPVLGRRCSLGARIALDWPLIAGRLAATTEPRTFAGGTLAIACAGPVALELQHAADLLIERVNRHLGQQAVLRLRLLNGAPRGIAARPAGPARPDVDHAAIGQRLAGLPEGTLRDALAALAAAMQAGGC